MTAPDGGRAGYLRGTGQSQAARAVIGEMRYPGTGIGERGAVHARIVAQLVSEGWSTRDFRDGVLRELVRTGGYDFKVGAECHRKRECSCGFARDDDGCALSDEDFCPWRRLVEDFPSGRVVPDAWRITARNDHRFTVWVAEIDVTHPTPESKWEPWFWHLDDELDLEFRTVVIDRFGNRTEPFFWAPSGPADVDVADDAPAVHEVRAAARDE